MNNASVSECCDEVSLLACSVAAAYYVSFIVNQYLIAIPTSHFLSINNAVKFIHLQFVCHLSQLSSPKLLSNAIWFQNDRSDYALQVTMENSDSENLLSNWIQRFLLELFENYVDGISADNKLSTPQKMI